ncbi:MAG: exodeoxyribonuclease VII large subunit, partial [Bacteroidetes bacterium]|nr:exodeoxyribonuclease VII large subunit [Bacteroidota bacterium]
FSLKDEGAQITCVQFASSFSGRFAFREGEQVRATGSLTVYPPRGTYQLQVRSLKPLGAGDLYQQFLALKEKLALEGIFDTDHKRPLPHMPRHLAVITSPTGAVIQDILHTLQRRYPALRVSVIPAQVQGPGAVPSLLQAFEALDRLPGVDVAILARGGGSMEDLWCFNDEGLAYTIYQAPVPVISAVGHETDFTIADFVADVRAPTPTAAAELATPERDQLLMRLQEYGETLRHLFLRRLRDEHQYLDDMTERMTWALSQPVQKARLQLGRLRSDIYAVMSRRLHREKLDLQEMRLDLQQHDVRGMLAQGYSLTLRQGRRLRSIQQLKAGDTLETLLPDGTVHSTVGRVEGVEDPSTF